MSDGIENDKETVSPQNVEIEQDFKRKRNKTGDIATDIIEEMTCSQIFTLPAAALLFFIALVASFHFMLFYVYSSGTTGTYKFIYLDKKEFIWVFLLFSITFTLLFLWLIVRWRNMVR